ncbi:hypothetical protein ACYCCF_30625 [Streptomyces argenteolus]|uniref:hypothetical protein n=1 Tax=Streptomyces sp. NPDC025273 TaxID=3155251 RepID=UPI0033D4DE71
MWSSNSPRPSEGAGRLSADELTALAREIVVKQTETAPAPASTTGATAISELRKAVDQLADTYKALAPAKITLAREEDKGEAATLLAEAERMAAKVAARARA